MRRLTYVMFKSKSGRLVGQGVEVDLCVSTDGDEDDLRLRIMEQLRAQIELDRFRDRKPLSTNRPAPERFAEMARRGEEWERFDVDDVAAVVLVDCR